ncbi:MAG: serine/threonine protein kinase [Kofleriaceae bacterium]
MGVSAETGAVGDLYCPLCERMFEEGERCPEDNARLVRIAQQSEQLIGRELDGRYTIVEKLGQGGMGTVFRGTQHSVAGREVAIKVVTPSLVTEPTTIKRFLREATIASRLSHPNAVSVLDFGQTKDGLFYLVMELVTGRTLDTIVEKDGRLAPARIVRIGAQICDALEGAHQLQIIHRDLKPQNVIVLSTGRDLIKVLDFGLAKSLSKDMASATMTNAGALLGSPAFMPPEVVTGQTSDARADLYSLGCLLYFCAAGELPFKANTIHELIAMHASEPPRKLTNVPLRLANVIEKLLAKSPDDRYPSAIATREALEESLGKTLMPSSNIAPPRISPVAAKPSVLDDNPENDTSQSTVLGWDSASSAGKPGAPVRATPPAGVPVRHSAAAHAARPTGPAIARTQTPAAVRPPGAKPPADPRLITATPIDPRTGKPIDRALPIDPAMGLGPRETPAKPQAVMPPSDPNAFDPRERSSPNASPFNSPGSNPSASPFTPSTNSHAAPFDPRGTNPASNAFNAAGLNPSANPFDPSTSPHAAAFNTSNPAAFVPTDSRAAEHFAASGQPAMTANPVTAGLPPTRTGAPPHKRSTALLFVVALLVVAAGATIAFLAINGT